MTADDQVIGTVDAAHFPKGSLTREGATRFVTNGEPETTEDSGPAQVMVGAVESMRLWVYGDGAAMTTMQVMPDNSRPPYRATRVWVRRDGRWQMVISQQTDIAK